jgi:predicted component of type VI protein secretion system
MRAVAQPSPQVQNYSKPEPVARVVSTPIPPSQPGTRPRAAVGIATAQAVPVTRARIVSLRPDGTDASSVVFEGEALDLGRNEGSLKFEGDPYLAARHVRIERRERSYFLYPLDFVNGVYVRIREPQQLTDFDSFLVGRQVLRFEVPLDAERDARPAIEHGVAVFGSPLRPAWGRLRQLTVAALSLDVYYLTRAEIVIGREEGNIRFLDDEHMSRKHAALSDQRGRILLEDLGSSNGTYLRVRQPRELRSGDLIRMGDQLLRFEL